MNSWKTEQDGDFSQVSKTSKVSKLFDKIFRRAKPEERSKEEQTFVSYVISISEIIPYGNTEVFRK